MLDLDEPQRSVLIETLRDAANVVLAGALVGQLLSDRPFSWELALAAFGL
jgi:hypothetical protein